LLGLDYTSLQADGDAGGDDTTDRQDGGGDEPKTSSSTTCDAESSTCSNNNDENDEKILASSSNPYFTIRDGQGRLFACRVYHEDELEPQSIFDSIFDEAIELGDNDYFEEEEEETTDDNETNETEEEEEIEEAILTDMEMKMIMEMEMEEETTVEGTTSTDTATMPETLEEATRRLDKKAYDKMKLHIPALTDDATTNEQSTSNTIPPNIQLVLSKLNGMCVQIHKGDWWSYEWCHEGDVTQFHVNIDESDLNEAMQSAARLGKDLNVEHGGGEFMGLKIESITTVGSWSERRVLTAGSDSSGGSSEEMASESFSKALTTTTTTERPIVRVEESFQDGEFCEAAGTHRSIAVTLECCRDIDDDVNNADNINDDAFAVEKRRNMVKLMKMMQSRADNLDSSFPPEVIPFAALLSIEEISTCKYRATVCTNVLVRRKWIKLYRIVMQIICK